MASKRSLQLFKKLKKLRPQQRLAEASNPEYGRLMLSLLTPTQYAELFPKWYRAGLPDVGGFRAALTKRTQDEQQKYFDDIDRRIGSSSPDSSTRKSGGGSVPNVDNMTPQERNFLGLVLKYESGNKNVPNYINDKTHTAQGYYQLTNTNWRDIAPKLGITAPTAMAATKEEQTRVALALLRQSGEGNWTNWNPQLREAVNRGEVAQTDVPETQSSKNVTASGTGSAPDFTKDVMYESSKGQCGIGVRKLAAKMYGHSPFNTEGLAVGGDEHAGSLSRGNNYFQRSGLFKTGRGIGSDYLTSDYLDSLPIGTVVSSEGGHRGGHVQIKIGPGKWASDFSQNGYKFIRSGYDNFVIHEPNETGLTKLSENGVMQAGATGTPATGTSGELQVQPQRMSEVPAAVTPTVIDNTTVVEPELPDRQTDRIKTVDQKSKEANAPVPSATVGRTEKKVTGPRTFNLNDDALVDAIKRTDEYKKKTAGVPEMFITKEAILDGFFQNQDVVNAGVTRSGTQVTFKNFDDPKVQSVLKDFGDTKKILTEVPANTPAYAGGGRRKVSGSVTVTRLDKKHRGDTTLVTDSKGKQFTVDPEKESVSVNPNTNVMDIKPHRQEEPMSLDKLMAIVRKQESYSFEGDYTARSKSSSAGGAYQFLKGKWKEVTEKYNVGKEYKSAADAPKEVQEAVARPYFKELYDKYGGDVVKVLKTHFTGNPEGRMSKKALAANRGVNADTYVRKILDTHGPAYDKMIASKGGDPKVAASKTEPKLDASVSYAPSEESKLVTSEKPASPVASQSSKFVEKIKGLSGLAPASQAEVRPSQTVSPTVVKPSQSDESMRVFPSVRAPIRVNTETITPGKTSQMDLLREEMKSGFDNISQPQLQTQQFQQVKPSRPIITEMPPDPQHQNMVSTLPAASKDPYGGVPSLERAANRAGFNQDRPWAAGNKH